MLRICEDEKLDNYPQAVLKWQWELHVRNMNLVRWEEEEQEEQEEQEQALDEVRKKVVIC